MKKRLYSVILSLFMALVLVPCCASAAESVSVGTLADLKNAIDSGATNITITQQIVVDSENVFLDPLAPVTINAHGVEDAIRVIGFDLTLGHNISINSDSSILYVQGGKVFMSGTSLISSSTAITVNSGYVRLEKGAAATGATLSNTANMHISNATLTRPNNDVEYALVCDGGKVILSMGTVDGLRICGDSNQISEITNGTIERAFVVEDGNNVSVTGGKFPADPTPYVNNAGEYTYVVTKVTTAGVDAWYVTYDFSGITATVTNGMDGFFTYDSETGKGDIMAPIGQTITINFDCDNPVTNASIGAHSSTHGDGVSLLIERSKENGYTYTFSTDKCYWGFFTFHISLIDADVVLFELPIDILFTPHQISFVNDGVEYAKLDADARGLIKIDQYQYGFLGEPTDLPAAPTKDGYTFKGWFDAPEGGNQITSAATLTQSTTVYAQWEKNAAADLNGLVCDENGVYYYYLNGEVQTSYTGLVEYAGMFFYVENGILNWNYTGLAILDNNFFYVENGMLNWNYTGLAYYAGTYFYIENGMLNWNYTGLSYYAGLYFYVENGMLNWDYTGLAILNNNYFYIENGILNWDYTGLAYYSGIYFYIENGMLNWNYDGICNYAGVWFYIEGGMLTWNYNGTVTGPDGTPCQVINSVLQV